MNLLIKYGIMASTGIPDGSTITPIDDYTTWLRCAGIPDTYGSLTNVIANTAARDVLCNNKNALKYMVRSISVIMPAVLANSGWVNALDNSTYSVKIPAMTSNTTPNGTASATTSDGSSYAAYKAFDRSASTLWASLVNNVTNQRLNYHYATPNYVYKFGVQSPNASSGPSSSIKNFKAEVSTNSGSTYSTIATKLKTVQSATEYFTLDKAYYCTDFSILVVDIYGTSYCYVAECETYGLNLE